MITIDEYLKKTHTVLLTEDAYSDLCLLASVKGLPSIQPKPIEGDAISREKVCDYLIEFVNHEYATDREREMVSNMVTGIKHMPSIQFKTKVGHCVKRDFNHDLYCSECDYWIFGGDLPSPKYCPNCGAKMEEE